MHATAAKVSMEWRR